MQKRRDDDLDPLPWTRGFGSQRRFRHGRGYCVVFIPGVGWGSRAWPYCGALRVRSAEAARDDGWAAAGGIGLDALATYLTAGLTGWAFDDTGTYLG